MRPRFVAPRTTEPRLPSATTLLSVVGMSNSAMGGTRVGPEATPPARRVQSAGMCLWLQSCGASTRGWRWWHTATCRLGHGAKSSCHSRGVTVEPHRDGVQGVVTRAEDSQLQTLGWHSTLAVSYICFIGKAILSSVRQGCKTWACSLMQELTLFWGTWQQQILTFFTDPER